jgi:serine/threonine protein kinase
MPDPTPDRKSVFGRALELPAADRAAYLDAACGGHPALRAEVEGLLHALDGAGQFLNPPPADGTRSAPVADDSTRSHRPAGGHPGGVVAGRYKLLQRIGEGGMGEVWMADQTEPVKRRVAVKLVRADRGASQTILSRFEAERQAIALMSHPNIANLLDAGTTADGGPFFVMELVKGVPLTEYCDAHKLSVPGRLGLFAQICAAVQHAHQKGVIHRDLKPSNILVESHDGKPVPKVIDFGLAKATTGMQLTEHTLFTAFGTVAGTPLYMAPEQATFNAIDVDSRADIYALGVILYELLAGTTPIPRETLRAAALDEVLRVIREQEPPPPSARLSTCEGRPGIAANRQTEPAALGRFVKGELDWIVMKALAKERERRYESATALAADVGRFLADEPVTAGPPSQWYRLRKFARRNKGRVTAAAVLLLALVAGVVGTTSGMVWAFGAERQAKEGRDAAVKAEGEAAANAETAHAEAEKVKLEQDRTRRLLYASELARGSSALAENRDENIFQALAETTPKPGESDLRGWEWHYLNRLYHPPVTEVRLGSPVAKDATATPALVVGPRSVATRGDEKGIWFEVYDTASGKQVGRVPKDGTLRVSLPPPPPARPGLEGMPWEGAGGPARISLPAAGLDPDGRYLAVPLAEWDKTGKGATLPLRLRLWRVETGEELDGPPAGMSFESPTVGPDAAWVAWLESPPPGVGPGGPLTPPAKGVTFRRWVRATKTVESRPLASLDSAFRKQITADGRSVLAVEVVPMPPNADEHTPSEMCLQCWDVTADPPNLRFKPNRITWPTPVLTPLNHADINPAGTRAAVWNGKEVVVYNLADGEPQWRHTVEHVFQQLFAWELVGVNDDGRRVVLRARGSGRVMVVEHPPRFGPCLEWVIRHDSLPLAYDPSGGFWLGRRFQNSSLRLTALTLLSWEGRTARPSVSGLDMVLSPDGRTAYVGGGSDLFHVGLLDLSTDPCMVRPEDRPRRTLQRVKEGIEEVGGFGHFEVYDADGRNLGPVAQSGVWCELLADRWVLCSNPSGNPITDEGGPTGTFLGAWELLDTADPKRFRHVVGGTGRATRSEDGRWVVVRDAIGVRTPGVRFAPHWATTTIYRVDDGRKACETTAPRGSSFVAARVAPGGSHWVALTQPTPPGGTPDPGPRRVPEPPPAAAVHTLRFYDLETGREVWSRDLGNTQRKASSFHFCRDRKRVIVQLTGGKEDRVSVVSTADGRVVNEFRVPSEVVLAKQDEMPDGTLVFQNGSEVQLWDAATGKQLQRFPGHELATAIALTPDARRMFVLDVGGRTTVSATVHVWDTATGRELLVVPAEGYDTKATDPKFEFADGKLRYSSTDVIRVLDGTPLPEPKK